MIPIGIVMANFSLGPAGDVLYDIHRSIRRSAHPARASAACLPSDQSAAAAAGRHPGSPAARRQSHALGALHPADRAGLRRWIATSAYRAPIKVFWLFELPPIWPVDQPFSEKMFGVHRLLGIALASLICMHIGAALFHHFVRKDDVLMRMVGR